MIRAALLATLIAAPAGAAVYVPTPVTLSPDGITLIDLAAEGLDPNRYDGGKAKAPAPVPVAVPRGHVRWACYWRTAGAYGSHDRAVQGCPDPVPLAQVAAAAGPRWFLDWPSGGSTTTIVHVPRGPSPVPIPLGGTLWSLLAALGALAVVRQVQS